MLISIKYNNKSLTLIYFLSKDNFFFNFIDWYFRDHDKNLILRPVELRC